MVIFRPGGDSASYLDDDDTSQTSRKNNCNSQEESILVSPRPNIPIADSETDSENEERDHESIPQNPKTQRLRSVSKTMGVEKAGDHSVVTSSSSEEDDEDLEEDQENEEMELGTDDSSTEMDPDERSTNGKDADDDDQERDNDSGIVDDEDDGESEKQTASPKSEDGRASASKKTAPKKNKSVEDIPMKTLERYDWINRQLPLKAMPLNEDLKNAKFKLISVSKDLTKVQFARNNKKFNNPTLPLKQILAENKIDFIPAAIKGWDSVKVLIKKKLSDKTKTWVVLSNVIPSSFRSRAKKPVASPLSIAKNAVHVKPLIGEKRKTSEPKTSHKKHSAGKKVSSKLSEPPPKTQLIHKQRKLHQSQKSHNSVDEINGRSDQELQQDESYEHTENIDQERSSKIRKVDANKVLAYDQKCIGVKPAVYHSITGLALSRTVLKLVFSLSTAECMELVPHLDVILKRRGKPPVCVNAVDLYKESPSSTGTATQLLSDDDVLIRPVAVTEDNIASMAHPYPDANTKTEFVGKCDEHYPETGEQRVHTLCLDDEDNDFVRSDDS